MTLLVKNEVDIIEANIRVHAALGVDSFVVMDHMSTDGTREILDSLRAEYEMHIVDQHDPIYKQSKWMTGLAFHARDKFGADWVVSNDADEFWLPQGDKSLKEVLAFKGSCVTCDRFNMVLDPSAMDEGYKFYDSKIRVDNPIFYRFGHLDRDSVAVLLAKIDPKAIVNPNGLIKMKGGNHGAKHIAKIFEYRKPYDRIKKFDKINVYHYPVRSYDHFESSIRHRKNLLENDRNVRMGSHYKRWVEIYNKGMLREEYFKFIISEDELKVLKKFGVIVDDEYPGRTITGILGDKKV